MPRFDGTGPRGMGPLTGRGMGFCTVPLSESVSVTGIPPAPLRPVPVYGYRYPHMRQLFPGVRRGRSMGVRGRGRGRGRG